MSFISATVGYTAGTFNGAGPAILKSTDGGVTFSPCNVTSFGADLLLLDVDAAGDVRGFPSYFSCWLVT